MIIAEIYAEPTVIEGFEKLEDDVWTHIAASFTPPLENGTGGEIVIYINGDAAYTLANIADVPPTTLRGVGGLTLGGPLPQDGEGTAANPAIANAFIGRLDNVAVWNVARSRERILESYSSGLRPHLNTGSFTYNNFKVAVPFMKTDHSLIHAFTFDDGGASIENYAWKQDWYNGFAHALSAPLGRTIYEGTTDDTVTPPVFTPSATNILVRDDERDDSDILDTDGDGIPDGWEIKHFGNIDVTTALATLMAMA